MDIALHQVSAKVLIELQLSDSDLLASVYRSQRFIPSTTQAGLLRAATLHLPRAHPAQPASLETTGKFSRPSRNINLSGSQPPQFR